MDESSLLSIRIDMEALITEREGMIAENQARIQRGEAPAYTETEFCRLSEAIRELRTYL